MKLVLSGCARAIPRFPVELLLNAGKITWAACSWPKELNTRKLPFLGAKVADVW